MILMINLLMINLLMITSRSVERKFEWQELKELLKNDEDDK